MEDAEVGSGPVTQVTHDDMTVVSNNETADAMRENFDSEEKPKDGEPETDEEKRSKAAKELGKAGGKAAAEKRAAEKAEPEEDDLAETPQEPEKEAAPAEEEEAKPEPKPRSDARARVMQATQKLAEERRRADELEARLAKIEAERAPNPEAKPAGRPPRELYSSDEDWIEALADWKTETKVKELQAAAESKARQDAQVKAVVSRIDGFNERVAKAGPDVLDKVDPGLLAMTPTFLLHPDQQPTPDSDIAQGIIESEHSAALLLHLSDNPEDLERLRQQPDSFAVARALGALEAKVAGTPKPAPKPAPVVPVEASKAAPPVRPVSGSPQYAEDTVDGDTDFDEFVRVSNLRDQRRRSGR